MGNPISINFAYITIGDGASDASRSDISCHTIIHSTGFASRGCAFIFAYFTIINTAQTEILISIKSESTITSIAGCLRSASQAGSHTQLAFSSRILKIIRGVDATAAKIGFYIEPISTFLTGVSIS